MSITFLISYVFALPQMRRVHVVLTLKSPPIRCCEPAIELLRRCSKKWRTLVLKLGHVLWENGKSASINECLLWAQICRSLLAAPTSGVRTRRHFIWFDLGQWQLPIPHLPLARQHVPRLNNLDAPSRTDGRIGSHSPEPDSAMTSVNLRRADTSSVRCARG